jgi:PIN domain nuclease of toxin-antitoxin system
MRLLLDTHVLLWWLANQLFAGTAWDAIADPANDVQVSVASAWEMAIKRALGKLDIPNDLEQQISRHGFTILPISLPHALAAGALPRHHTDPFDRMLIAQAQLEALTIVTRDPRFANYGVPIVPA